MSGFKVQAQQCATCIYRADSPLDLTKLEAEIADPHGGFRSFRVCHHSNDACCRGFWNRHKDAFAAGQIAQRLGMVRFVTEDQHAATNMTGASRVARAPRYRELTPAQATVLFARVGGARERVAPVATLRNNAVNIVDAYAADGTFLGSIAWRPHQRDLVSTDGLFVCG